MLNRIRLYSGLVLLTFVCMHLFNHGLGLISFEAMDAALPFTTRPWRSWPGTLLLGAAVLTHSGLSLTTLYRRQTLRLKAWEAAQTILGLLLPLFLMGHVLGTRGLVEIFGVATGYELEMLALWVFMPEWAVMQTVLLLLAWSHGWIGLTTWVRLKPGYQRWRPWISGFGLLWPTLALAGYVAAGTRTLERAADQAWIGQVLKAARFDAAYSETVLTWNYRLMAAWAAIVALVLAARWLRLAVARRQRGVRVIYRQTQTVETPPGATVLEALRAGRINHASVCGGRGRCSTCRIKVGRGADWLAPPGAQEQEVLERISAPPGVRLACQIRPTVDLEIEPLLPPIAGAAEGFQQPGYLAGQELEVAIVFVDLRASTKLSEDRLPYDFVFVLNQFFAAIDSALVETGGHYAQFNGDGLMAIYGLDSGLEQGCAEALEGARAMLRQLDQLNRRLESEIPEPLAIGIGIHCGEAIVGSMGPPAHPIISAIGDNVNVAARLEALCKDYGVPLVVSDTAAGHAGVDLSGSRHETVQVRGREQSLEVYAVDDPLTIGAAADAAVEPIAAK